MKRRKFLGQAALGSGLLLSNGVFSCKSSSTPLNILVLGGTYFLGPAIVNAAVAEGHQVALFNRGITNPGLFPKLTWYQGDRTEGVSAYEEVAKKDWDVIIDVWPEKSILVEQAAEAFSSHQGIYLFISSIAVYDNFQEIGLHEESSKLPLGDDPDQWSYSEEKAYAEEIVQRTFVNHMILRPGPIKGWRDPALDLLYWLVKLRRNEPMLVPGSGEDPLQFIDVKTVAQFALFGMDKGLVGIYNATGPLVKSLDWHTFITTSHQHLNSSSSLHWASEAFLKEQGVRSFDDLPLWVPLTEDPGFMQISMTKSLASGFKHRQLTDTIDDCLTWFDENYAAEYAFGIENGSVGLTFEKEQGLLSLLQ